MIEIREIREDLIPGGFIGSLPKECSVCGEPLSISEPLTKIECTNPKCKEKEDRRIMRVVSKMGLEGYITEGEMLEFVSNQGLKSPYLILAYNSKKDGEFVKGYGLERSEQLNKAINRRRGMLLWEYVDLLGIPELEGQTEIVVGGEDSLEGFLDKVSKEGIQYIQRKMVGETEAVYVPAVLIYQAIKRYEKELRLFYPTIVPQKTETSVGVYFVVDHDYMTQREFIEYLSKETGRERYIYANEDVNQSEYIFTGGYKLNISKIKGQEAKIRDVMGIIAGIKGEMVDEER